jgi:Flp pilus assembly protein TadG
LFLITLLLGAVELSRVAYAAIEVSNAARAAAQYGAMNGGAFLSTDSTGMDSTGMLNAAQGDAGDLGSLVQWASNPTYTCSCSGTGTASCTPPAVPTGCTTSHIIVTVTVNTKAVYDPLIYLPGITSKTITLYGSAQEEVLQ